VVNPDSAERAAKAGMNFISNSTAAMVKAKVARYTAPIKPSRHAAPKFGMNRYMVLAETEEKALEIGRRAYRAGGKSFMALWHKHNTAPTNVNYPPEIDGQIADGRAIATTPAKALELLRGQLAESARTIWSAVSPSAICRCRNRRARWSCSSATSCRRCARACRSRRNSRTAHEPMQNAKRQRTGRNTMKPFTPPFLKLAGAAALLPAAPYVARAQAYPAHPVKFIVGQAAGSSSDITARLIAQFMSDKLGQQFVVEARPGAAGNIATEFVTRAPADGYTLLLVNAQNTINAALYDKLNFDFLADIAPVGGIDIVPLVMEVNPSFRPTRSLSSSPTPRPIRASSTWRRPVSAVRSTSPVSCSSPWPGWT
jgi:hypothetical protein